MTQLEIINLALLHMGNVPITQVQLTADEMPSAIAANIYWEPCRDEVLGEARWSFATATEPLSVIDDLEDLSWEYGYDYPTMSVGTVWNVFNEGTIDTKEDQQFEVRYVPSETAKVVFTDLQDAYAEITYKVTDPEIWNDKFNMAFSYRLSANMCMYITGDAEKSRELMNIYLNIISEAKRLGHHEKRSKPNRDSGYVNAR